MLAVRNLTIDYFSPAAQRGRAVDDVNFDLAPGETLGFLGESGSGKTTTALALLGIFAPDARLISGSVRFRGEEILHTDERRLQKLRGAEISIVLQEPASALNPVMRVGEQIGEVVRAHTSKNAKECRTAAEAALDDVQLSRSRFYSAYPHQLSAGQRQRVAIAQAIVCSPALLIADEPTSALDNTTQAEILALFKDLKQRLGLAILFITHNPALLIGLASRALTISAGRIIEDGRLRLPVPVSPLRRATAKETRGAPLLKIRDLTKQYVQSQWFSRGRHTVTALDGVNLDVQPQSTLALIGESGAGKSTLARCLVRLEQPDSGHIVFDGRAQLIFQDSATAFNPRFTASEIVEESLRCQAQVAKRGRRELALAMMKRVGLSQDWGERAPRQFSGGQRQRLAIARALVLQPDFLILDEALSGLDQPTQAEIITLLLDLQADHALTYLFITHDIRLASTFADEMAVLHNGKIIESGPFTEMLSGPQTAYTRQLMAAVPGGWS